MGGGGGGRLGLPGKKWKCSGSGSELKVHCEKKNGIKTNVVNFLKLILKILLLVLTIK